MTCDQPYVIQEPALQAGPFVFASPHSGEHVPETMMAASRLSRDELRRAEDCYVDQLFNMVPDLGAPLLSATFSRTCLDLNRSAFEMDPDLFEPRLKTRGLDITDKVRGGLGVIPRIVAVGQPIYSGSLPATEAAHRIKTIHQPYHKKLADLMTRTHRRFGKAILIDCHSMPSGPVAYKKTAGRFSSRAMPDVVIGDRWGSSADRAIVDDIVRLFRNAGYSVEKNKPYAGGWCTRHYGDPEAGYHAIQIELSRALYMDERTFVKTDGFDDLRDSLTSIVRQLIKPLADKLPLAAE